MGVTGTGKAFTDKAKCMCAATCTDGKSTNEDGSHTCSSKMDARRRAQAARMLSTAKTFTTKSKMELTASDSQGTALLDLVKNVAATDAAMATVITTKLTSRIAAGTNQALKDASA